MLRINELQGRRVVLSGDALLDPVYLAQIACLLKVFGATAAINKVDYLYLQVLHGGDIPDEDGVAGIDADVKYQDEIVEDNDSVELTSSLELLFRTSFMKIFCL